ncbi:MAG: transposase [Planctomycetes bacterium]|nr:transposase [Planctomycetota bacterium]
MGIGTTFDVFLPRVVESKEDRRPASGWRPLKRQYCGRTGKIDNGQIGVFLAYASPRGGTLVGRRLYLPREWARRPKRRRKAHVPDDVRSATAKKDPSKSRRSRPASNADSSGGSDAKRLCW